MRLAPQRLVGAFFIVVSLLAVASRAADTAKLPSGAAPPPPGMRVEAIADRWLKMDAYFVAVPVDWHFQGVLAYGTACDPRPFPAFRASSPDGLTQLERMPRLDWGWTTPPQAALPNNHRGCLPLRGEMSASDFLKHLSEMLHVQYVEEVPLPARAQEMQNQMDEQFNARFASAPPTGPTSRQHSEVAQAKVRYQNGSFAMEGLVSLTLHCIDTRMPVPGRPYVGHVCGATVRMVRAPEGRLDEAVKMLQPAGAGENARWSTAYTEWNTRLTQENIRSSKQQGELNRAQTEQLMEDSRLRHEQFQQSQAMQQHMHEEFLSTLQRGTDISTQRAAQGANARSAAASDMVDYALGQQTVRDPSSGQLNKASATHSYIWADETGRKSFQTSDPNANPNGVQPGTWTLQQQVHGDGTSR